MNKNIIKLIDLLTLVLLIFMYNRGDDITNVALIVVYTTLIRILYTIQDK